MMKIDWLYYVLCGWAGLSLALVYVFVLDRMPTFPEMFVIGLFIQWYIDTVTIPYLRENRIMLPGLGYTRIAIPETDTEGGTSNGKVVRR